MAERKEGRRTREEGRGKREEGRGCVVEGEHLGVLLSSHRRTTMQLLGCLFLFLFFRCFSSDVEIERGSIDIVGTTTRIKQCRHGYFIYHTTDVPIGRALDLYGEWSEFPLSLLLDFISQGDVVLDIGGNIGTFAIPFANAVGLSGEVHTFEPQPHVHHLLMTNKHLNTLPQLFAHNVAIGNTSGIVNVPDDLDYENPGSNHGGFSLASFENYEGRATTKIHKINQWSLDSLEFIKCPSVIKIDTEGYEAYVLQGGEKFLTTVCSPIIYIENNCEKHSSAIINRLDAYGYQCLWDVTSHYNANNYAGNSFNAVSDLWVEINMLCIPKTSKQIQAVVEYVRRGFTRVDPWYPLLSMYYVIRRGTSDEEQAPNSYFAQMSSEHC